MKIRPVAQRDRDRLCSMLTKVQLFSSKEVEVAIELIDIVLNNPNQKDYEIDCAVEEGDQAIGYICYGPVPMTEGTFDLYWIVVDPQWQGKGIGSKLFDYLEAVIRQRNGKMILVDTSSSLPYERTRHFYRHHGFQAVARIPDYYHPGNDRITFCKKLTEV